MNTADELERLANESGAAIVDAWGRSHLTLPGGDHDYDRLAGIELRDDVRFIASVDGDPRHIELSAAAPDASTADAAARLATSNTVEDQIRNAGSGWEIARLLGSSVLQVEARYERANWCRTNEAFETALHDDWLEILDLMTDDTVVVGEVSVDLDNLGGEVPIRQPLGIRPEEEHSRVIFDGLSQLAEANAWRSLATSEQRLDGQLQLTLHDDQAIRTALELGRTIGGVDLWRWATSTEDANRLEALRHVLRFITATSSELPVAPSVQALAERHRIALSRENAAEVQRAIADGRNRTSTMLESAQDKLTGFVEDTSKSAQAVVVATIGIVALVARNADALPQWLVVLIGIVGVVGVVVSVAGRGEGLDGLVSSVTTLQSGLTDDPLIPESDRASLLRLVGEFDVQTKATRARRTMKWLGGLAIVVIVAATAWLVLADSSTSNPEPPTDETETA